MQATLKKKETRLVGSFTLIFDEPSKVLITISYALNAIMPNTSVV